jgi:hypothetical protein
MDGGHFENIINRNELVGIRSTNGPNIMTERERLTLLDVNVDGQHEDPTKPLIQPTNTVRKPLSIQQLERELLH